MGYPARAGWVMGYGLWVMGYGIWVMGYGLWVMGYGLWVMGYGLWVMGYGLWVMGYGLWDKIERMKLRIQNHSHTPILPYSHTFLEFFQQFNDLLPFQYQVSQPVITDPFLKLVGKFELPVVNTCFEIFKRDIGILF